MSAPIGLIRSYDIRGDLEHVWYALTRFFGAEESNPKLWDPEAWPAIYGCPFAHCRPNRSIGSRTVRRARKHASLHFGAGFAAQRRVR